MIWWIVAALILMGLVFLVVALRSLAVRLVRLQRAGERLRRHRHDMEATRKALAEVSVRLADIQRRSAEPAATLATIAHRARSAAG